MTDRHLTSAAHTLLASGLATLVALTLCAANAGADLGAMPTRAKQPTIQGLVDQLVATAFAPGAVAYAGTSSRGVTVAAGVQDLKTKRPMTVETRFRAGSVTKTFTATLVLQLVGAGTLSLDDSVEKWLPGIFAAGKRITIRELLNHTSGLFNYTRDPVVRATWGTNRVPTPAQQVTIAARHPLEFDPGTGWGYSSTNYQVLGLIIEKATGQSLRTELRARLLAPLGLRNTDLVPSRDIPGPHAHGYYLYRSKPTIDVTRTTLGSWADGAIVSNVRDIARFYTALLGGKILAPPLLREMKTTVETGGFPDGEEAGLGIFRGTLPCGRAWSNSGGVAGFLTKVIVQNGGRRVVVIATNGFLDEGPDTQMAIDRAAARAYCRN